MKIKRTSTIAAVIVAISILATGGIFKPSYGQTAPNDMTHLGVREKDVVNLQSIGAWYYKVARDGSIPQGIDNRYIVPAGRVLVITDFTASFSGTQSTNARVNLFQSGNGVYYLWRTSEKIDSNGWGKVNSHWTSGLLTASTGGFTLSVTHGGNINNVFSWIAGYEVDASALPQ
jgi:hypothetical protein